MPAVTHIVLFKFKPSADPSAIDNISQRMLALQQTCRDPVTSKPYIKSITGGTDHSPEGLQNDMTHAFVVDFASVQDRDYYVHDDPAHAAVKKLAGASVERAQVVDFTGGQFGSAGK